MKRTLYALAFAILLLSCSKPETSAVTVTSDTTVTEEAASDPVPEWSLEQYEKQLQALSNEPEAVMQALDYFKFNMDAADTVNNDKALKIFLEFQEKLVGALNNRLMESSDYEDINTLAYADSTQYTAKAFEFQKRISDNGLAIAFEEGSIFIESNPAVIKEYFVPYVTSATKTYLALSEREITQPSSADAGIIISVTDFADRLGAWDTFLQKHPDNLFAEKARNNFKFYRYFFLVGMDNTPVFDYDRNRINEEQIQAYHYYLDKYPNSTTAGTIRAYLNILKKADFTKTEEIEEFTSKYSIYN